MIEIEPPLKFPGVLIEHCGSTYTCNPAPTNTDVDFICLAKDAGVFMDFEFELETDGWKFDLAYDDSFFTSVKKSINGVKYNYIVTDNEKWFVAFLRARELCKELNLMDKQQRIKVHHAFLEEVESELNEAMP